MHFREVAILLPFTLFRELNFQHPYTRDQRCTGPGFLSSALSRTLYPRPLGETAKSYPQINPVAIQHGEVEFRTRTSGVETEAQTHQRLLHTHAPHRLPRSLF